MASKSLPISSAIHLQSDSPMNSPKIPVSTLKIVPKKTFEVYAKDKYIGDFDVVHITSLGMTEMHRVSDGKFIFLNEKVGPDGIECAQILRISPELTLEMPQGTVEEHEQSMEQSVQSNALVEEELEDPYVGVEDDVIVSPPSVPAVKPMSQIVLDSDQIVLDP